MNQKNSRQMKPRDMTTELDRAFSAVTRNARMSGVVIGDRLDPLYAIHKALNAKYADGELTDEQYTKKARELMVMLDRFGNAPFHKTMA